MNESFVSNLHTLIQAKDYPKVYDLITKELENIFSKHIPNYVPEAILMDISTQFRPIVSAYRTIRDDDNQPIEYIVKRLMNFYPHAIDFFES